MIDLTWTTKRFVSPPAAQQRVLVVVDRASADMRLLDKLAPAGDLPPTSIVWLWVVTPGAVVSWGALLAESGDRTRMLLTALSERMEEARRYMTPLQQACKRTGITCEIHVLHGSVAESVVRLARTAEVDQLLLATESSDIYGQPAQDLATSLARRLTVPVGIL